MRVSTAALAVAATLMVIAALAQPAAKVAPDTLLVLRNGAEVRGVMIELKDWQYSVRLADGRVMQYPVDDVERIERLEAAPAAAQAAPPLAPVAAQPPPPAPAATAPAAPVAAAAPEACRVFLYEKGLDESFYTPIRKIEFSTGWFSEAEAQYPGLADKAAGLGADAVLRLRTWRAATGMPYAGGLAVKLTPAGRAALPTLKGRCL